MATLVGLQSIPHELVLHTLGYCDYLSILRFSCTCKHYHKLIAGSSVAQLQIELGASGFQLSDEADRSRTEATASQLLEEFRRYRDGWLYLQLRAAPHVTSNAARLVSSKLQQGIFAETLVGRPVLPWNVRLTRLSTGATHTLRPSLFSEFQIDPSQDLLVLVSIDDTPRSTISLRSLKDGTPHGGTCYPDWSVTHPSDLCAPIFIEVSGDLLAIQHALFGLDTIEIVIWDWKRAVLLNCIESPGICHAFTFLTSDSLVLAQYTAEDSLEVNLLIYQGVRTPQTSLAGSSAGEFVVSGYRCLKPRACFELPMVDPNSDVKLHLQSKPTPSVTSSSSSAFLPLPETRILQLNMTPAPIFSSATDSYEIYISIQRLLAHLPAFNDQAGLAQGPVRIPWTDWVEYSTRWFHSPALDLFPCRAFGTRSIQYNPFSNKEDQHPSQQHISILDFHTPTVRRFSSLGCDARLAMWPSKDARRHIDYSSPPEDTEYRANALRSAMATDQGELVFVDTIDEDVPSEIVCDEVTIRSRLPYRIVTRVQPFARHSGWMMDNGSIIGRPHIPEIGTYFEQIDYTHLAVRDGE